MRIEAVRAALPHPAPSPVDLRTMLRVHIARRAMDAVERAGAERTRAIRDRASFAAWRLSVREAVAGMVDLGKLPRRAPKSRLVSRHEREHHVVENVIFESLAGWQASASVFIPRDPLYRPPYRAVVVPCGHGPKAQSCHQLPCHVFARAGLVAVTFEPPGMAAEKRVGNDHFVDGPRCYALGDSSQRYFLADAIRAMDYLAARPDVDARDGFAMTGVSGGGHSTMWSCLIDDRIKAVAPVCSATRLEEHGVLNAYASCPEIFPIGRLERGLDDVDLMIAACDLPQLYMAGRTDEVFSLGMSEKISSEVAAAYEAAGAGERFAFFADDCGHDYTPRMARRFVEHLDRFWLREPGRAHADSFREEPTPEPAEALVCSPSPRPNMFTITSSRARKLSRSRRVVESREQAAKAVRELVNGIDGAAVEVAARDEPRRLWLARVEELLLHHRSEPDTDIYLPATLMWPQRGAGSGAGPRRLAAIVGFDDRGRWAALDRMGWLAASSRFIDREPSSAPVVLSVDLRGWGDSSPTPVLYDMAGWSGPDRATSYLAASLSDGLMSQRVRDGLAAASWLRAQAAVDPDRIALAGRGLGGIVAIMVAAILPGVRGTLCLDTPESVEAVVRAERVSEPLDIFMPGLLRHTDVSELARAVGEVRFVRARKADGKPRDRATDAEGVAWLWERLGI